MQTMSIGGGLAALAFWGFVAVIIVAGIWSSIRRRDARQETLRRAIDSGQSLEPELVQKILSEGREQLDRELKAAGLITLFIAPGLAILGWFISFLSPEALMPILGAAVLVGCVSAGLLVAARAVGSSYRQDDASTYG
jgi:Domain of unknown function (DUF6249)